MPFAVPYGFFGVHLFFIISGFVILMSLDSRNGDGFVKSRFIRLYPVYWASVILSFLVTLHFAPPEYRHDLPTLLVNLTMFQAYVKVPDIDGVYWSLAYELGFYVFSYGAFRLAQRTRPDFIGLLPLWLCLGAVLFYQFARWIPHPLHLLLGIHSYAHLFAAGIALYLIRKQGIRPLWIGTLLAAPFIQYLYDGAPGLIAVALSIGIAVIALFSGLSLPKRIATPLIGLGTISYALYLTHQMIGYVILAKLIGIGMSSLAALLITLVIAILIATTLCRYVERPAARWLKTRLA